MFEGMSDDEEEFQSVSLGTEHGSVKKPHVATDPVYLLCPNVFNRGARRALLTEAGCRQESDPCLWATAVQRALDL